MVAMFKKYAFTIALLIGVLCVLGYLTYSITSPQGKLSGLPNDLKALEPDESAMYTDLEGNRVSIAEFKGKPLIVNSWATWVPFSRDELLLLDKVKEMYGDQISVLAINRMENVAMVKSFLTTYSIPSNVTFLIDPTDYFYKMIGGYAMPETTFYNRDGSIVKHMRGVLTEKELDTYIGEALLRK